MLLLSSALASHVLYLNADGVRLRAGASDARNNTSSVLRSQGVDVFDVPPYRPGKAAWDETVSCVRRKLADFDVQVVTERPSSGRYAMVAVGGEARGLRSHAGGLAPSTRFPLHDGVVFAFDSNKKPWPMCSTIVHEYGHLMGLDHPFQGDDLMRMGSVFLNQPSPCGQAARRKCKNGEDTQNSWQRMVDALGLAPGARRSPPDLAPTTWHEPHDGACAESTPSVMVTTPLDGWLIEVGPDQPLDFTVHATDPDGIHDVQLAVARIRDEGVFPDNASLRDVEYDYLYAFPCGAKKRNAMSCTTESGKQRFRGTLPPGRYRLRFVADDAFGHRMQFERHVLVRPRG
jgi:hypothetical protein